MNLRVVAFCCAAFATAVCIFWIDKVIAPIFGVTYHIKTVERIFSGPVLATAAALFMVFLLGASTIRGHLTKASRILVIACGFSILAYLLNRLLKILFGRLTPSIAAHNGVADSFHFLQGDSQSGFPSGHMALVGAFVGVLLHFSPSSKGILLPLFFVLGAVLVIGNWHYLSDVIAGGVLGLGIGLLAANSCGNGKATGDKDCS